MFRMLLEVKQVL